MNYVFDTNIILVYLKDPETKQFIEQHYGPFDEGNTAILSAVSIGEIKAIGRKNGWGEKRLRIVKGIMGKLVTVGIRFEDLFDAYAEIDAFSQGRIPDRKANFTARNMGKNDLWIAATAAVTNSALITTDKDFEHLDGEFFEVIYITPVKA
ncbi:MAG: PIN domain-containing protein [Bacteroidota bacterium]